MDEIDVLAADLQQALAKPVALSQIKTLIENRKIAELKSLFPAEQEGNINKMFYYLDKRGYRQTTGQIVFADYEYVVVRSRKYSSYSGKYYHAVWVIGVENGRPWIHRLPWNERFEDENFTWTAEYVRWSMGFTASINEPFEFELNKPVRLQGDLTVTKVRPVEEACPDPEEKECQINFRIGNHVVIIASAIMEHGHFTPHVIVSKPTRLAAIHHEHGQVTVTLPPGVYQINLLERHRMDRRPIWRR